MIVKINCNFGYGNQKINEKINSGQGTKWANRQG